MPDPTNFRRERIEKLLNELRYEVERGMRDAILMKQLGSVSMFRLAMQYMAELCFANFGHARSRGL